MPWNTTPARGVADSSVSLDLGTPHTAWRSQHGAALTFGGASSPEPSPVPPVRTPASAMPRAGGGPARNLEAGGAVNVSFNENNNDMGIDEVEEDWVGTDWLRGVADLYAQTGETAGPHNVQDLEEFVARAMDFHVGSCVEGGGLPSAIMKTWLLLHVLFYDSPGNLALWPLPPIGAFDGADARRNAAASWADIEKSLRPPTARNDAMEQDDDGDFDAGLCHLRRVLFWLETSEIGDPNLDQWLATFYEGVANCTQRHNSKDITLKGCASELSVVDLSQLIWWHLRRGEMAVAQARCRFGSGETTDRSPGAKQWWRAASLDASLFLFEPSQRAVMAGSKYSEWHEEKYNDYVDERLKEAVSVASQGATEKISSTGWLRHRRLCEMKATQSAQQAVSAAATQSSQLAVAGRGALPGNPRMLSLSCDVVIHHALAGGDAAHVLNLGGVHAQRLREILRSAKVLRKWEDELWLDLRRIFTTQVAKRFEGKAREDVLGEVRLALRRAGDVVNEYDTEGGTEFAEHLGEIQRRIMAVDLPGLVQLLEARAELCRGDGGMEWLGLCAHLVIFFKVVVYLHRGGTVQRQGVGWQESLKKMLSSGDQVLRTYVLDLIARKEWNDIPMLLRIMQNHFVPGESDGAQAFNEILKELEQENAHFVQQLSVNLLAEVEAREPNADVRREVMILFEQAMGKKALKRTGKEVAGGLEDRGAQELGVRLQEIFQQTGQWDQAVHQAHHFLRGFVKSGRSGETGSVVSMLLGLVKDTAEQREDGMWLLGSADFDKVWQFANGVSGEAGGEELVRVLVRVRQRKEEADQLLLEFMDVWHAWSGSDVQGRRDMLFQRPLEQEPPGQPSGSLFETMSQCVPGASRGVGGPRDCAEHDALVRAARGYVEALWEVLQLASRLPWAQEALDRLAWMLRQLAKLCIWGGVAQAFDNSCGGVQGWREALGSQLPLTQQGRNEVATGSAVLEGGAIQCLYKTLVVLGLRPVWVALDSAEGVVIGDSFRDLMKKTLEYLVMGEGGYLDVCIQAGATLAHLRGAAAEEKWNSLALGLAGVVADERAGVFHDLSDECIEKMISGPWAQSALSLWCS